MNFYKRAVRSVTRRLGKTIVLLIIIFLLGSALAGAISAYQAVGNTESNLRRNLPPFVTIQMDWDGIIDYGHPAPEVGDITVDLIREIGQLSYVYDFDFSLMDTLISFDLDLYEPEGVRSGLFTPQGDFPGFFQLQGVEREEVLFIEQGVIELVEGRTFTSDELNSTDDERSVAIISSGFAQTNNLSLHETFTLEARVLDESIPGVFGPDMFEEEKIFVRTFYEFEVVGIYNPIEQESTADENSIEAEMHKNSIFNRIYVPNQIINTTFTFQVEGHAAMVEEVGFVDSPFSDYVFDIDEPEVVSFFVLNDPLELDAFREAVDPMLPEFIIIHDLLNTFERISTSMETLQQVAGWVLWGTMGVTLLVLSLLITLFLHDRRHEIGIYLALGEKNSKIISQIMLEVVAIALLGMTLAVFSGYLISSEISQNMLHDELAQQSHESIIPMNAQLGRAGLSDMAFSRDMTHEEMLEQFDVSLTRLTIVIYYGVGIGVVALSTLIPVIYIIKLNPKKVLL